MERRFEVLSLKWEKNKGLIGISEFIKAFARIDRIDEFNQGDFTIRPLQQLTVYYGGEFKMQFV